MGKGKKNREQASTPSGTTAPVRNILAAKVDASLGDQLRAGRHPCRCQARRHALIRNCMGCGKIVCEQEGSGPCFYCGTLVCTKEEREIIDRGSNKSAELYRKLTGCAVGKEGLSLASIGRDLQRATDFRNKLLDADADSERRTKVNDLECDYSTVENNAFISPEERAQILNRKEELRRIREQQRRTMTINLNLADLSINEKKYDPADSDPIYDPVIQGILDRSEDRRKAADAAHNTAVDARWVPQGFVPKYSAECGAEFRSNTGDFLDADNLAMMNDSLSQLEVERRGYALALPQPVAALVAHGRIRYFRFPEDLHLKGPIFVSSTSRATTSSEIDDAISRYSTDGSRSAFSIIDYSPGSVIGRVFVDDCITFVEFQQEYGVQRQIPGSGDFVVLVSTCEPLTIPVPHLPPQGLYQMDKTLKDALTNVFKV